MLHEHHLIIRVGAGLIKFVYGSHSRMAADLTLDKNLYLLPFSRIRRIRCVVQGDVVNLQCVAVRSSVLPCLTVWCSVVQSQCALALKETRILTRQIDRRRRMLHNNTWQLTATYCNSLQHTATHCNTLQHTATHCNTLQHTATHCSTLQHIATHCIKM